MGLSGGSNELKKPLLFEYVQKYIARDGATPTRLGPRPLKSARRPSYLIMYLRHSIKPGLTCPVLGGGDAPQCERATKAYLIIK